MGRIDSIDSALSDADKSAARRFAPKRRREFGAGRAIARMALAQIGIRNAPLPVSEYKYPVWPDGTIGSISHTSDLVGAAVAYARDYRSIGFDLEAGHAVEPEICQTIMRDNELSKAADYPDRDLATVYFSCKEAVYKAVYPSVKEFLEFLDVEIAIGQGTFSATCGHRKRSADAVNSGKGFFEQDKSLTTSLFLIE